MARWQPTAEDPQVDTFRQLGEMELKEWLQLAYGVWWKVRAGYIIQYNKNMESSPKSSQKLRNMKQGNVFEQRLRDAKFDVQYESQSSVGEYYHPQSRGPLRVQGTFSCSKEDSFNKITQISVGDKVFIIKEHFDINPAHHPQQPLIKFSTRPLTPQQPPTPEPTSNSSEQSAYHQTEFHRKDRKNIVKNVIKAFLSWIKKQQGHSDQGPKQILQGLIKTGKFNNSLVVAIIKDERLNPMFAGFLGKEGGRWLAESKIVDKEAHKQCIQSYLRACHTMNFGELRVFKRKSRGEQREHTEHEEHPEEMEKKADSN